MPRQRRRYLEPAEHVRDLRRRLGLTQLEFAARLGVHVRTIIRGEQRGLELPLGEWGPRGDVWKRWVELQSAPAVFDGDRHELGRSSKCHVPRPKARTAGRDTYHAIARPRPKGRLRLSRDLLRAHKKKRGRAR